MKYKPILTLDIDFRNYLSSECLFGHFFGFKYNNKQRAKINYIYKVLLARHIQLYIDIKNSGEQYIVNWEIEHYINPLRLYDKTT